MVLATLVLVFLTLKALMLVAKAAYWWDNIYFAEGIYIEYPHPDKITMEFLPTILLEMECG